MLPVENMSRANRKKIAVAYVAITFALVATTLGSGWCWTSQVGPWSNRGLRDVCLAIWLIAGVLLALSQVVFIGLALRMKDGAVANADLARGAPAPRAQASLPKVVILVSGIVVLLIIALVVVALSNMPS